MVVVVAVALFALALAACTPIQPVSPSAVRADGEISGTLVVAEGESVPAGSDVIVEVLDLTDWTPVSTNVLSAIDGVFPLAFSVPAPEMSADGLYGLVARVMQEGTPIFVTMEPTPFTDGVTEGIELMLTNNADMLASADSAGDSAVTGTVTYLQRIALPASAVITVRLQDVSRQDVAATLISEQVIVTEGEQVPVAYTLPYDPAEIDDRYTYSVSARIEIDGQLAWISDTMNPVISRGAPTSDVEIVVVQVQ
jgi:putative lipoprotein